MIERNSSKPALPRSISAPPTEYPKLTKWKPDGARSVHW